MVVVGPVKGSSSSGFGWTACVRALTGAKSDALRGKKRRKKKKKKRQRTAAKTSGEREKERSEAFPFPPQGESRRRVP